MFRDSYVRTCSKEFSLADDDLSVHLTNDAVQKHLGSYGQFEDANKLSFQEFEVRFSSCAVLRGALRRRWLMLMAPCRMCALPLNFPWISCRRF